MKLLRFCACLSVLILAATALLACAPKAKGDYMLYTYDPDSGRFIEVGCRLTLGNGEGDFCLTYLDTVQLFGATQRTDTGYVLKVDPEVYLQAQQALGALTEEQEQAMSKETFATWSQSVTISEQIFECGDYAFSSASVDLIRRVEGENKRNYTAVDGYYESTGDAESIYLFRDGKVYGNQKDDNGKATYRNGEPIMNDTPNAAYTLRRGFIVLTRIDAHGEPVLKADGTPNRVVYLLGGITYPKNVADFIYTEDEYSEATKSLAAQLAGKTVGVLTKTIYATEDISKLDFD